LNFFQSGALREGRNQSQNEVYAFLLKLHVMLSYFQSVAIKDAHGKAC
jgi:hypothetical protein